MGNTSEYTAGGRPPGQICAALLAHVDAGKTTLSEALLYAAGAIRRMGKVDAGDVFLDTDARERARGITIFSKQARLTWKDAQITLLDTPGHVDFSAEMERVLQVSDYAILVVSGADGVQGHTRTLWSLLQKYRVPVFLFVNKMDQRGTDRAALMAELTERLDDGCVDFSDRTDPAFWEDVATCDEAALEQFLETGRVEDDRIRRMIAERRLFPCFFGSALKFAGVEELLDGFVRYAAEPVWPPAFSARVYKISRDGQGNRLTHLKVTGGTLKVRDPLSGVDRATGERREEKVSQIRLYSGEKYETAQQAAAGTVCAVTGLSQTFPGQDLGECTGGWQPVLEPVLSCRLILPPGCDPAAMLPKLRLLEEEQPELHIVWDERLQEIQAQIMGEVQTGILRSLIAERFGVEVEFGPAGVVYKETIANAVEGVGHFEPLRHYAEVHLLLEPLPPGSGLVFDADCSEDMLAKNWQRLILTHLREREHRGVLTGSAVTDLRITLVAGRAHQKHTEGGDFRQATYRAVRQGLMEAESVLLEPYYDFRLELPEALIGRAMTDIEKRNGTVDPPFTDGETAVLTGYGPVSALQDYQREITAYSKGLGRIFFTLRGYGPCHNAEEVIAAAGYDPQADPAHSPDSVFCAHGAGFVVPWDQVKDHMQVESPFAQRREDGAEMALMEAESPREEWLGTEEVDAIIEKTFYANSGAKSARRKGVVRRRAAETIAPVTRTYRPQPPKEEYLLVDGYNIIFAWDDLKELAQDNIDAARGKLMDALCNYQGMKRMQLIVVFDAYRVAGHDTEVADYHNIHVVFTREAETADQYIEKFAHTHAGKYQVTVATSDGLEQIIIRGAGCRLLSAQDLRREMEQASRELRADYMENRPAEKNRPLGGAIREAMREKEL